ncbi:hypothetical protein A2U01_0037995, partial [Trifolium medium]|nr:hypothetical protein [Trifolium medium]
MKLMMWVVIVTKHTGVHGDIDQEEVYMVVVKKHTGILMKWVVIVTKK